MKKFFVYSTVLMALTQTVCAANTLSFSQKEDNEEIQPVEITYLEDVYANKPWKSNWFISLKGGLTAFVGRPVGHGDIFDRTKPMLNISFGKWITPYVGAQFAYQGFKMHSSNNQTLKYNNIHADFMYDIAAHFSHNFERMPRWNVIPYVGLGIINNASYKEYPFAISYGIIAKYHLSERLHLAAEIGNTTTFQNFDGIGNSKKLGDHLLQAGIGLDVMIGHVGWTKVIDPKPFMLQNDLLQEKVNSLRKDYNLLNKKNMKNELALKEMHKILEIEGLLDKYDLALQDYDGKEKPSANNYSGLNSLRARLRNRNWNGNMDDYKPVLKDQTDTIAISNEEYFKLMKDGKIFVGSPIFFFFQLGTDNLTDKAQIINIKEIAATMKRFGLSARIVGAADSQTGTAYVNEKLSEKRAEYIASQLKKCGVGDSTITTQHRGGINVYKPQYGNRNTCIMLYFNGNANE